MRRRVAPALIKYSSESIKRTADRTVAMDLCAKYSTGAKCVDRTVRLPMTNCSYAPNFIANVKYIEHLNASRAAIIARASNVAYVR